MALLEHRTVTITTATIFKVVLIMLLLWFLYMIRDVITMIFVAFVLSSAIRPWVNVLERRHIPRPVSAITLVVLLLGLLSISIVIIVPALVEEIRLLTTRLPDLYRSLAGTFFPVSQGFDQSTALSAIEKNLQTFSQGLLQISSGIVGTLSGIFGGVTAFLTVLVIGFFMTIEENGTRKLIQSLAPVKYQPYLTQLIGKIEGKMGSWLRGQLFLSLIIGTLTFIGLSLLGVRFALVLALLAGFMEVVPFIGPILAALPAVFFAVTDSPVRALIVVVMYVIIQQLENNLIVPKVMQQTVGLHPLIILIALLVGARVGGIVGIILAVPIATIVTVFLRDLFEDRRKTDQGMEKAAAP